MTFPYKFGNNFQGLIQKRSTTNLTMLGSIEKYLSATGTFRGFSLAYRALLQAIEANDQELISQMCEKTLALKLNQGLNDFRKCGEGSLQISLENKLHGRGKPLEMTLIDF